MADDGLLLGNRCKQIHARLERITACTALFLRDPAPITFLMCSAKVDILGSLRRRRHHVRELEATQKTIWTRATVVSDSMNRCKADRQVGYHSDCRDLSGR